MLRHHGILICFCQWRRLDNKVSKAQTNISPKPSTTKTIFKVYPASKSDYRVRPENNFPSLHGLSPSHRVKFKSIVRGYFVKSLWHGRTANKSSNSCVPALVKRYQLCPVFPHIYKFEENYNHPKDGDLFSVHSPFIWDDLEMSS